MRLGLALALIALALLIALPPSWPDAGQTRQEHRFVWRDLPDEVGGLSAIAMRPDGQSALAISDHDRLFEIAFRRDGGQITAANVMLNEALNTPLPPRHARKIADSEGLALTEDGTVYISFEGTQTIRQYDPARQLSSAIPMPEAFDGFGFNSGLEALAIDSAGRLYTLPEAPPDRGSGFPLWRFDGDWQRFSQLPARDRFRSVAADIGPDGRFYLLERKLTVFGFQSRLRRWDMAEGVLSGETTLFTSRPGQFDNLEGLSIWRNSGLLIATLVSDDNFLPLQRTEIVELLLQE